MGGAVAALGSVVSGVTNLMATRETNSANESIANSAQNFSAQQTVEQQQFAENQADTVIQRGAADMEAAGINPILAAATPDPMASYTQAQPQRAAYSSPTAAIGAAMQAGITNYSALQSAAQAGASIDKTVADTNLSNVSAAKTAADTTTSLEQAKYLAAQTAKLRSGSAMSDLVGTDAASKGSQFLNNAVDNIGQKVTDIISGIRANSSGALSNLNDAMSNIWQGVRHPIDSLTGVFDSGDSSLPSIHYNSDETN